MSRARGRLAGVAVALATLSAACGSGDGGRAGRPIGDDAISQVAVASMTGSSQQPLDAVPSPDGAVIFYTAAGEPAGSVVRVAPGGASSVIAEGGLLAMPSGISVTTDGARVLVADQRAGGNGAILGLPAGGARSDPVPLPGTQGYAPRGLDVVGAGGGDLVYFTGADPVTGAPGLFRIPAAGGSVTAVAQGAPFRSPDSAVVAKSGDVYVTDQGDGPGQGIVYRVSQGKAAPVLTGLTLGSPAGITLINGDDTLLVSSIDATSRSNQVLFLDLPTGKTAAAHKVIGVHMNSSGGLHRAHAAAVLAWADVQRPGRVYRVEP
jgi:sugar lactone lactonase YvrE